MSSGWNRGTGAAAKPQPKKPSALRGIIAGVVCACLAAAVAFLVLSGRDEKPKAKVEKAAGLIKEVVPAKQKDQTTKIDKRDQKQNETNVAPRLTSIQLRNRRNGIRDFIPPAHTTDLSRVSHTDKLFSNSAERMIAGLLVARPGGTMACDPKQLYGERFRKSLEASLFNEIKILETDSEYDRNVKQMVIDTKKDLFARVRKGEDPCQIMIDTYTELKNLGLYKKELEAEVKRQMKSAEMSDADAQTLIEAANKMLSERGITAIRSPVLFKNKFRLMKKQMDNKAKESKK